MDAQPIRGLKQRDALPDYAVFTAIEGTLLDFDTFDGSAARPLVRTLHAAGVPVIPVTVMTLEEMEQVADDLFMRDPMIIEGGGAIARWRHGAWQVEAVGAASDTLLEAICDIEALTGAHLAVYSALSESESARLSGRRGAMLHASMQRRFSEPFLIERGEIGAVSRAAASLGFSVHRGKRFYYLTRTDCDGRAFHRLREEIRCGTAIGVGGSPIDAGFLSLTDIPIAVPRPDGQPDRQLLADLPNVMIASAPGAAGWAAAVSHVWSALQSAGRSAGVA